MLQPIDVLRSYRTHDDTLDGVFQSRMPGNSRPFAVYEGKDWSRAEFRQAYLDTAALLVGRGIRKGDRVGVVGRNHIGHLLLLFACARIGAILVPANPELKATELGYIFQHSEVSALFCDARLMAIAREAVAPLERAPWLLPLEGGASAEPGLMELLGAGVAVELPVAVSADDTCIIIYTSGTTGFPKGAMHSQRAFVASGESNIARLWLQPDDRLLIVLPLFHLTSSPLKERRFLRRSGGHEACLTHFGGFLLHRGCTLGPCGLGAADILSTGGNAVSPRQDIQGADDIGVFLVAALHTSECRLRLAVVRMDMPAGRTRPAGVVRWHSDKPASRPRQLVVQLSAELEPSLIENGFVQAGLGPNVFTRLLDAACC